jgi:hypothetical protein
MEPEGFQRTRGTAFDRGRIGRPAELNAAHVDALNDSAVRRQLERLGLQMPPRTSSRLTGRVAESRNCKMVADDQGRQRQGGLSGRRRA